MHQSLVAHILPLAVLLGLNVLTSWLRIENSELPWYRQAPEHWIYPLQTVLCGGLLILFRRHYVFGPWRYFSLAVLLAGIGIGVWIMPSWFATWFAAKGEQVPNILQLLGVVERWNGFNPNLLSDWPAWQTASVAMRFVRLVVVVPIVEEVFWRGFLMRYLAANGTSWEKVPFGTHRWKSFFIVTLLVMLAHQPQDYAGAVVFGALMYFLAVRSKSLGACVVMHAVANLLLGIYIIRTHTWGLW